MELTLWSICIEGASKMIQDQRGKFPKLISVSNLAQYKECLQLKARVQHKDNIITYSNTDPLQVLTSKECEVYKMRRLDFYWFFLDKMKDILHGKRFTRKCCICKISWSSRVPFLFLLYQSFSRISLYYPQLKL